MERGNEVIEGRCPGADVFTIGFSNRTWAETVEILTTWEIETLVDVRTLPGSRRFPHFNKEALEVELPAAGIRYVHVRELGGLRKPIRGLETNAAWRNDSFRAYADYMQGDEFAAALNNLIDLLSASRTVYACTEAVPWRCHRSLISDALLVRGIQPCNILSATSGDLAKPTPFARIDGISVTYPKAPDEDSLGPLTQRPQ